MKSVESKERASTQRPSSLKTRTQKLQEALRLSGTMSVLVDIEEYDEPGIKICPNGTQGESLELGGLVIVLPAQPPKKKLRDMSAKRLQMWQRDDMPQELSRFALWMSGSKCQGSSDKSFLRISRRSLDVGVRAFGSITTVSLRILRVGIT